MKLRKEGIKIGRKIKKKWDREGGRERGRKIKRRYKEGARKAGCGGDRIKIKHMKMPREIYYFA